MQIPRVRRIASCPLYTALATRVRGKTYERRYVLWSAGTFGVLSEPAPVQVHVRKHIYRTHPTSSALPRSDTAVPIPGASRGGARERIYYLRTSNESSPHPSSFCPRCRTRQGPNLPRTAPPNWKTAGPSSNGWILHLRIPSRTPGTSTRSSPTRSPVSRTSSSWRTLLSSPERTTLQSIPRRSRRAHSSHKTPLPSRVSRCSPRKTAPHSGARSRTSGTSLRCCTTLLSCARLLPPCKVYVLGSIMIRAYTHVFSLLSLPLFSDGRGRRQRRQPLLP